jgi:hypothetical protein
VSFSAVAGVRGLGMWLGTRAQAGTQVGGQAEPGSSPRAIGTLTVLPHSVHEPS